MESYKRKSFYQDRSVAESYLDERFSDPKGRRENEATRVALERALERIPGAKTILDMPCGNGRFTRFFHEKGYLYCGADVSIEMLEFLAAGSWGRGGRPSLVRCDGEYLPFKDNAFDCVVCVRFLNLIPGAARQRILREMRRVSAGWLIVQSHHLKTSPFVRLKVFLRKLTGGDARKYMLRREIINAGWSEKGRIRIQHTGQGVGIFYKTRDCDPLDK